MIVLWLAIGWVVGVVSTFAYGYHARRKMVDDGRLMVSYEMPPHIGINMDPNEPLSPPRQSFSGGYLTDDEDEWHGYL